MSMRLKKFQTYLGFLEYFIEFQKARIPFRFPSIPFLVSESSETLSVSDKCFGNRKGILGYFLGYSIKFYERMGILKYFCGFREYEQGFRQLKKVFQETSRGSNSVLSKTRRFPRSRKPKGFFCTPFIRSETLSETEKGFREGFRASLGFPVNGFFLECRD